MSRTADALFGVVLSGLAAAAAADSPCRSGTFEGVPYTACAVNPLTEDLRLWHRDTEGRIFGTFSRVNEELAREGLTLGVAMNGGMYHDDRSAVGLYVEDGKIGAPLVTAEGPGNFGMLPNGVFCVGPSGARVMETHAFEAEAPDCTYASQSGPMLVMDGALHPRFLPDSDSAFVRNGVGLRADGTVVLAISDAPVNFHRFARLFRDELGTPNALYIDGKVSRLHDRASGRSDFGWPVGPILGTVEPLD